MEAKELRIGNIVRDKRSKQEEVINELSIDGYNAYNSYGEHVKFYLEDIEGIPLTEGWLLRMGFEKEHNTMYVNNVHYLLRIGDILLEGLGTHSGGLAVTVACKGNYVCFNKYYVHDIQNITYALTGTELTIK